MSGITHWIILPDDHLNVHSMWMSPDGSSLAMTTFEPVSEKLRCPFTYTIINVADGTELARTLQIEMMDNPTTLMNTWDEARIR